MATQTARRQRKLKARRAAPYYSPDRNHPGPGRHPLAMPMRDGVTLAPPVML
ncbi:MAG: hypothetical protein H7Y15_18550, partial [Pseudonocardia sp.]|nr:hypothetical protein [Pseudonocardia sp.]